MEYLKIHREGLKKHYDYNIIALANALLHCKSGSGARLKQSLSHKYMKANIPKNEYQKKGSAVCICTKADTCEEKFEQDLGGCPHSRPHKFRFSCREFCPSGGQCQPIKTEKEDVQK
jgi:hypothetical protein